MITNDTFQLQMDDIIMSWVKTNGAAFLGVQLIRKPTFARYKSSESQIGIPYYLLSNFPLLVSS